MCTRPGVRHCRRGRRSVNTVSFYLSASLACPLSLPSLVCGLYIPGSSELFFQLVFHLQPWGLWRMLMMTLILFNRTIIVNHRSRCSCCFAPLPAGWHPGNTKPQGSSCLGTAGRCCCVIPRESADRLSVLSPAAAKNETDTVLASVSSFFQPTPGFRCFGRICRVFS